MKKLLIPVIIFFFAGWSAKQILQKRPEVSIKTFNIDSISLRDITFLFDIELYNPYPIGFKLDDIGFTVRVEGKQLLQTRTKKGVKVKPGSGEVTPVKVTLVYEDIIKIIKDYSDKDYLNCAIDVEIVIPLPRQVQNIKKNITFNTTVQKKLPAVKPEFKIANFNVKAPSVEEIKKSLTQTGKKNLDAQNVFNMIQGLVSEGKPSPAFDLTSIDVPINVDFDIELKNKTKAQLLCRDLKYDFFVNETKIFDGMTEKITNQGNTSVMRIVNTFSSKKLGKSVVKLFESRRGTYGLKGYSGLKVPDEVKKELLRLDFDEKGTFDMK